MEKSDLSEKRGRLVELKLTLFILLKPILFIFIVNMRISSLNEELLFFNNNIITVILVL